MKAAILLNPREIVVEEVEEPRLEKGWALIKTEYVGICGTDKAIYKGNYRVKTPLILGHEVIGKVVKGNLENESVVSEINFSCLNCKTCREGNYTHCEYRKTLGIDFNGGLAEYFVSPEIFLHKFNLLNKELGVFVEPLAAILNSFNQFPLNSNEDVAVIGTGNLANLACQVIKLINIKKLSLIAKHESKKLKHFDKIVDEIIFINEIKKNSFNVVFEASGDPNALDLAVKITKPRGIIHLKTTSGIYSSFNSTQAVIKELRIIGTRCGTFKEFKEAIKLLEKGLIKPKYDKLYLLKDVKEAFEESLKGEYIKIIIKV